MRVCIQDNDVCWEYDDHDNDEKFLHHNFEISVARCISKISYDY